MRFAPRRRIGVAADRVVQEHVAHRQFQLRIQQRIAHDRAGDVRLPVQRLDVQGRQDHPPVLHRSRQGQRVDGNAELAEADVGVDQRGGDLHLPARPVAHRQRPGHSRRQRSPHVVLADQFLQVRRKVAVVFAPEAGVERHRDVGDGEIVEVQLAGNRQLDHRLALDARPHAVPPVGGRLDVELGVDVIELHRRRAGDAGVIHDSTTDQFDAAHADQIAKPRSGGLGCGGRRRGRGCRYCRRCDQC